MTLLSVSYFLCLRAVRVDVDMDPPSGSARRPAPPEISLTSLLHRLDKSNFTERPFDSYAPMFPRVFIQNCENKMYLHRAGNWKAECKHTDNGSPDYDAMVKHRQFQESGDAMGWLDEGVWVRGGPNRHLSKVTPNIDLQQVAKQIRPSFADYLFKVQMVEDREDFDGRPETVVIRTDMHPQSLLDRRGSNLFFTGRAMDPWKCNVPERWFDVEYHGLFTHDKHGFFTQEPQPLEDSSDPLQQNVYALVLQVSFKAHGSNNYLVSEGNEVKLVAVDRSSGPIPLNAKWFVRLGSDLGLRWANREEYVHGGSNPIRAYGVDFQVRVEGKTMISKDSKICSHTKKGAKTNHDPRTSQYECHMQETMYLSGRNIEMVAHHVFEPWNGNEGGHVGAVLSAAR